MVISGTKDVPFYTGKMCPQNKTEIVDFVQSDPKIIMVPAIL